MFIKRDVHSFTVYIWDIDDQFLNSNSKWCIMCKQLILNYFMLILGHHQNNKLNSMTTFAWCKRGIWLHILKNLQYLMSYPRMVPSTEDKNAFLFQMEKLINLKLVWIFF